MKQNKKILIAVILSLFFCSCEKKEVSVKEDQSDTNRDNSIINSQIVTEPSSQNTTESISDIPVKVGEDIYQISSFSSTEKVTIDYTYGTVMRSEGAKVQACGKEIDFSAVPDEYYNDFITYCVSQDETAVYFADYFNFYKSDFDLKKPELLFTMGYDQDSLPSIVSELISFENTDKLFFRGTTNKGNCIGSIDAEKCEADYIYCPNTMKEILCNKGVMLYDYNPNDTVLYWECGKINEIKVNNPNECECGAFISANGKYICTFLWGKTEESFLIERYSVYDTHSCNFIKSFDWTFNKKVGDNLPKGFSIIEINEEDQCIYANNTEDNKLYKFSFGG